jgi:hypothetical protein
MQDFSSPQDRARETKTILSSHSQSPHNKDNRGMHPNGCTNQEEAEEARTRRQLYDRRGLAVWLGGAR